jgi:hypothetical protein
MAKHDSVEAANQSSDAHGEPNPAEVLMRWWEFITEPKHSNAIMAIFTMLIFLATVAYGVVAYFQLTSMNGQLDQMRDARRAWLGTSPDIIPIAPPTFTPLKADDGNNWLNMWMKSKVDIRNVGATPALEEYDAFVLYDLVKLHNGKADWEKTWCAEQYTTYRSRRSSGDESRNTAIFPQDAKSVSEVLTGGFKTGKPADPESAIIAGVLGCIIYHDIFGVERHTEVWYEPTYPERTGVDNQIVGTQPIRDYRPVTGFHLVRANAD